MSDRQVGLAFRAVRHHQFLRHEDVGSRAGSSRSELSWIERGDLGRFKVDTLCRYGSVLRVDIKLVARWRGGELARLLDADQAALQNHWKQRLERLGWLVSPEVSFSEYGERGRYDLLAYSAAHRLVLVVEIKTVIADVQELLGSVDAKARLARRVAARLGWPATGVVTMVVVADGRTNRRRVFDHGALFDRFALRGRTAMAWLQAPGAPASGLLVFSKLSGVARGNGRQAGRHRVRHRTQTPSLAEHAPDTRTGHQRA